MGKLLVAIGLAIALLGVLIIAGLPLGRLPGDIVVRRGTFTLYFPIVTCLALSLVFTLLMMLFRR